MILSLRGLYLQPTKKWEFKKMRYGNFFALICHGLCTGWTTTNRQKSGSSPSLKIAVAIQNRSPLLKKLLNSLVLMNALFETNRVERPGFHQKMTE